MDQNQLTQETTFAVGDQVELSEVKFSGAEQRTTATIVEVRHILGKQTYVIETGGGKRRVVGASQLSPMAKE